MNEQKLKKFLNSNKLGLKLDSYETGLFVGSGYESKLAKVISHKNDELGLKIDRCFEYYDNYLVTEVFFTNQTNGPIQLNSILIADMVFDAPETNNFSVFENGFLQSSYSGYLKLGKSSRMHKWMSGRDSNSISYKKSFGFIPRSLVSEWYSRIVDNKTGHDIVIGALTTDKQFTQIYTKKQGNKLRLRVTCQLDGIYIESGRTIKSEKIYIGFGKHQANLERFADLIAKYMKVKLKDEKVVGLNASYYAIGNYVDEKIVTEELEYVDAHKDEMPVEYLQLDAGYSPWGDWLDTSERFPKGLAWHNARLNERGMKGGIWFSPFTAMKGTKVYEKRQSWMLKDQKGKIIGARRTFPLDWLMPNTFSALDPTHPEVHDYLRKVTQTFVKAYGFNLLKLDFLYAPCMPVYYHKKNITRVEAIREGLAIIREAAGPKTILLSAISPMSLLVGYIDIARTTIDITSPDVYKVPLARNIVNRNLYRILIRNFESRRFLHNRVWQCDPDVMIANPKSGLSRKQTQKLLELIRDNGSPILIGDSLANLDNESVEKYIHPLFK